MLNLHNIGLDFTGESLFSEITFKIDKGDRIGLIGKNGAGKSTMLKILSGELDFDRGSYAKDKSVEIGFLKQDLDFEGGRSVLEESYLAFSEIKRLEEKMNHINQQLAERTDYESESYNELLNELPDLTHRYDVLGGYQYEGKTEKVLLGLGFKRSDFNQPTETFSGGWRMRIELAKLLLQENEVLLLDEPTNHLDIESIIWLEKFLNQYSGAVVLVSHDKMFLDRVSNRTIEISLGRIYDFKKPYSEFLKLREELKFQQLQAKKNQDREIKQAQAVIDRFKAKATKASMAQSMMKKLEKIERIEVDQEDAAAMKIHFPVSIQPGKIVLTCEGLTKSYGEKTVFENLDLIIERGKRIAFVGKNGQGKTTLAKIIAEGLSSKGKMELGHNVELGYFAQNQAEYLDGEKTLLDTMLDAANDSNRTAVRDMLGAFLFSGDDVEKKVKVLSGGERNRLALCLLLLNPFNVLVLDEPTNHLDIRSKQVLKEALNRFEGTLIVVSHDRDFLQGLTDEVVEFKNGNIKVHLGDIDYFLEQYELDDMRSFESEKQVSVASESASTEESSKPSKERSYQAQKTLQKREKQLKNKISKAERRISDLEKEIEQQDLRLSSETDLHADESFFAHYEELKNELNQVMEAWESLIEELESIN